MVTTGEIEIRSRDTHSDQLRIETVRTRHLFQVSDPERNRMGLAGQILAKDVQ